MKICSKNEIIKKNATGSSEAQKTKRIHAVMIIVPKVIKWHNYAYPLLAKYQCHLKQTWLHQHYFSEPNTVERYIPWQTRTITNLHNVKLHFLFFFLPYDTRQMESSTEILIKRKGKLHFLKVKFQEVSILSMIKTESVRPNIQSAEFGLDDL